MNPNISAYTHVYGPPNYNVASFVPIGMETLMHNKPKRKGTFSEHCSKGYGLGIDFQNYQLWIMWMEDTRAKRILATVFHKHMYITNTVVTQKDQIITSLGNLADDIKG